MRTRERFGIYRHEPASRCRWDECDGVRTSRIIRGTPPSRFLFRVIFKWVFHVRLITPKYPTSACGRAARKIGMQRKFLAVILAALVAAAVITSVVFAP